MAVKTALIVRQEKDSRRWELVAEHDVDSGFNANTEETVLGTFPSERQTWEALERILWLCDVRFNEGRNFELIYLEKTGRLKEWHST